MSSQGDSLQSLLKYPQGAFIPEHLEKWATITSFEADIPGVKLSLDNNGGLFGKVVFLTMSPESAESRYPCALLIARSDNETVSVFDDRVHGWDAVQAGWFADGDRFEADWKCENCGGDTAKPIIEWLGYQVFENELEQEIENILPYRSSFDSITIDLECLQCGTIHHSFLECETA